MELLSEKNPLLKQIRRAVSRGALIEDTGKYEGFAVAEGVHLLEEARAARCEIGAILVAESAAEKHLYEGARVIADKTFHEISSTETSQGVLALVKPPAWTLDQIVAKDGVVVVLDGMQDPGNAGAISRVAEAFEAAGVVFLKGTVNPYNAKCLRASAGSLFRLPLATGIEGQTLLEKLDSRNYCIFAAMPHATVVLNETRFTPPCAIVIGSEGCGVSETIAKRATGFRIATKNVESLNAAVAAGVILYEAAQQRSPR